MGYARFVGTEFRAAAARPLRRGSVYDEPLRILAAQGVKRRITCMNPGLSRSARGRLRHILRLLPAARCHAGASPTYTRHMRAVIWIVDARGSNCTDSTHRPGSQLDPTGRADA